MCCGSGVVVGWQWHCGGSSAIGGDDGVVVVEECCFLGWQC